MEFDEKLREIREHFGHLIDDDTAKMLAEYYFGKPGGERLSEKGRRGVVKVSGLVVDRRVFSGKGYCRVEVDNGQERVYVYFWDDAYEVAVRDIFPGMRIEVTAYSGESGFHVNSSDGIVVELDESAFTRLDELRPGNGICVRGRVAGIEGVRVTKSGKRMASFSITDGRTFVPLILWDDKVELADAIAPGDEIIVLNAYVNEYAGRPSVHAGRNSLVDIRRFEP
ncbi:OB-fold nucleic acid binding domain-containing protein [Geoglobus sp.]